MAATTVHNVSGAEAFSAMREEFVTSYEPMNAEVR